MKARTVTVALGVAVLACSAGVRAEDVPAAGAPSAPAAPGAGIKELPGTIQKDVADAVNTDLGGMVPGAAADEEEEGEEDEEDEE